MASKKFTDLTLKTTASASDIVPINDVSAASDKKTTVGGLATAIAANIPNASLSTMTLTNPYKFSVYRNSAASVPATTFTKVSFDTEQFDTGNNYDNATSFRFTAPAPVFCDFNVIIGCNTQTRAIISIYKNGAEFIRLFDASAGTSAIGGTIACPVPTMQLTTSDYIEVYVWFGTAVNLTVGNGPINTMFSGNLVSAT